MSMRGKSLSGLIPGSVMLSTTIRTQFTWVNPIRLTLEFRVIADATIGYPTLTCVSDDDFEMFYEHREPHTTTSSVITISDVLCLPHGSLANLRRNSLIEIANCVYD